MNFSFLFFGSSNFVMTSAEEPLPMTIEELLHEKKRLHKILKQWEREHDGQEAKSSADPEIHAQFLRYKKIKKSLPSTEEGDEHHTPHCKPKKEKKRHHNAKSEHEEEEKELDDWGEYLGFSPTNQHSKKEEHSQPGDLPGLRTAHRQLTEDFHPISAMADARQVEPDLPIIGPTVEYASDEDEPEMQIDECFAFSAHAPSSRSNLVAERCVLLFAFYQEARDNFLVQAPNVLTALLHATLPRSSTCGRCCAPGGKVTDFIGGKPPLHRAAAENHLSCLSRLLCSAPIDLIRRHLKVTDMNGATPLHIAAANSRDGESVKELILFGAELNRRAAGSNFTPLHCAAFSHRATAAKVLLDNGAKIDAVAGGSSDAFTGTGCDTPLHVCLRSVTTGEAKQFQETLVVLLNYGASTGKRDGKNRTPGMIAQQSIRDPQLLEFAMNLLAE